MYVVKADATDRDGNVVSVYLANADNEAPFTLAQPNALRYPTRDSVTVPTGFRFVRLRPRS